MRPDELRHLARLVAHQRPAHWSAVGRMLDYVRQLEALVDHHAGPELPKVAGEPRHDDDKGVEDE